MHTQPLIVAATHAEIASSIPALEQRGIPYIVTGVGMVATAHSLTRALSKGAFPYVLNVGIAGSFTKRLDIGALVEVTKDNFAELGAEDHDIFRPIEELGFGSSSWENIPVDDVDIGLKKVEGISVNTVHGNADSIARIQGRYFGIQTESMEGAAVFYVCAAEQVPCIQVRSISNYVERRDKSTWNIPLAVQNLNNWLLDFLAL